MQTEGLVSFSSAVLHAQRLHVAAQIPLDVLERRLFDGFHHEVVIGFNLEAEKEKAASLELIRMLV